MTDYPVNIAGTWVTSFNNWFQSNPDDLPKLFKLINNRIIRWNDPISVDTKFDIYFDSNYSGPLAEEPPTTEELIEEYRFLEILNPVPTATLSAFKFEADMTFNLWVRFNNLELLTDWDGVTGVYDFDWQPSAGTYGGTITINNPPDERTGIVTVHARIIYLLTSPDEMQFIMAYKDDYEDRAPSGAGTMRRVNVPAPLP